MMKRQFKDLFNQLPPFVLLGISIVLAIGIFLIFSYVLVWGLVIGGVLWGMSLLIQYIRELSDPPSKKKRKKNTKKGRIIEHDNKK